MGSGAGKADFQDLKIVKTVDKATPLLKLACASGKHITKGKLTVRKAGENPLEYLTIDLENILVSTYTLTGTSGSEIPDEEVTLNFAKMKTEYWTQTTQGAKGENANFSWDVSANQKYWKSAGSKVQGECTRRSNCARATWRVAWRAYRSRSGA